MGKSNEILAIQNISCESLGNFKKFLLDDGYRIKEILAPNQAIPDNIENFDAVFILGGPMSVNDNINYLLKEKQLIINSINHGIPVLGICLGSQLIADSCGGKVYRGTKKEIGWSYVQVTKDGEDSMFKNISDKKLEVFQWHGDTYMLPYDASIFSYSNLYVQSFKYKTAYGIQFHLEVTKQMIFDWIKEYRSEIQSENIEKQDLINGIDKKVTELTKYAKIVYKNFISIVE
ncbi:MAG: gamma-glutamyl-gamma-aminobutyrate hydrolase family protein [Nitrosopumilus sp.]|nr:gamma-glutamyl-gamma-aminobutyrate hydrolase family protein [Nitrosopumilus sp.]